MGGFAELIGAINRAAIAQAAKRARNGLPHAAPARPPATRRILTALAARRWPGPGIG